MYSELTIALFFIFQVPGCFTLKLAYVKKCDPKRHYNFDLSINVTRDIFVDGVGNLTKPFASPVDLKLELSRDGKKFVQLSSWHENNFCKSLKTYGGRLWDDAQRAAKMTPGECPIKPGVYTARKFKVDMSLVTHLGLPKGEIKITISFPNRNLDGCYYFGLNNY